MDQCSLCWDKGKRKQKILPNALGDDVSAYLFHFEIHDHGLTDYDQGIHSSLKDVKLSNY